MVYHLLPKPDTAVFLGTTVLKMRITEYKERETGHQHLLHSADDLLEHVQVLLEMPLFPVHP